MHNARLALCGSVAVVGMWSGLWAGLWAGAAGAAEIESGAMKIRLDEASGAYELSATSPAWRFAGKLPGAAQDVKTQAGDDRLGHYREIVFSYADAPGTVDGRIRLYQDKTLVLFADKSRQARAERGAAFPDFTTVPDDLHSFSYTVRNFAPPAFAAVETSTPWLLFDDQAGAAILSPASNFMVASMAGDGKTRVASTFNEKLRDLPDGLEHQTLLAVGRGINRTWDLWGRAMTDLQGKQRPANDADDTLKYLGYWTDNGATYYYHYDPDKGYAGTLLALVERYRQEQIPIRYLQLDSWWYYKTFTDADGKVGKTKNPKLPEGEWNRYGGLLEYRAHKDLFPDGLRAFQEKVGLPLVTHNRWIDPQSPYHQKYRISGVAAVDPKFWDDLADYLKQCHIVTYEQDWLDRIYKYSPEFSSTVGVADAFMDNMARACAERGITMQYCMPYPAHFLQGSKYSNLTTIRVSDDRFERARWNDFLYVSRLASALGEWPWSDVFMSAETENELLSTLSAGAVGIGDEIGKENKANILRAVRADGVIVKPDAAIVPLDASYVADARKENVPLVAGTYVDHGGGERTGYVFAFARPAPKPKLKKGEPAPPPPPPVSPELHFTAADLGIDGAAYVYDEYAKKGQKLQAGERFAGRLNGEGNAFYAVAAVDQAGIALLGDEGKFVGMGKQRVATVRSDAGATVAEVVLAPGETGFTLQGFATVKPRVEAAQATLGPVLYDAASGFFSVQLTAVPAAAERRVPVTFRTR